MAFVGPTLFCVGVFGLFAYSEMRQSVLRDAGSELAAIADFRASEILHLVTSHRDTARAVVGRLSEQFVGDGALARRIARGEGSALDDALREVRSTHADIVAVTVLDGRGRLVAATDTTRVGVTLPLRAEVAPSDVEGEGVRIVPYFDQRSPLPQLVAIVASPGVTVQLWFRSGPLARLVRSAGFGESGEVLLAARDTVGDGYFLTGVRFKPAAAGSLLARAEQVNVPMILALRGVEATSTTGVVDYVGTPVVAATRYLEDLDWGLVAKRSLADVMAPVHELAFVLLALAAVLATGGTVLGQYLGGRLSATATRLAGELDARTRAEARFRRVLERSPVAMIAADVEGRIVLANEAALELVGHDLGALLGMRIDDLLPEAQRGRGGAHGEDVAAAPSGGTMNRGTELVIHHRSGRTIPVEVGLIDIDTEDGSIVVASILDLTQRRRDEHALRMHATELERSNKALDDFAYVASHDLKAPLRGIDQLASFIDEDAGALLPEESRADLTLLRSRVARMQGLLDGLLQYSRVGREAGVAAPVDVAAVVRAAAELYVPAERFSVEIVEELPNVFAPRAAVDLVVRNILMNAVKHHDRPRGTIRVGGYRDSAHACVVVEDDGPGIPAEYAEKVFKLFQTLRPRDEVEGSGIGLALVKKSMESHGGRVELRSSGERGARFELRWPAEDLRATDEEAA